MWFDNPYIFFILAKCTSATARKNHVSYWFLYLIFQNYVNTILIITQNYKNNN